MFDTLLHNDITIQTSIHIVKNIKEDTQKKRGKGQRKMYSKKEVVNVPKTIINDKKFSFVQIRSCNAINMGVILV